MSSDPIILTNATAARRLIQRLMSLTFERPWKVTIERVVGGRTVEQNAVLRGMERTIAEFVGEDPDAMHEILLARRFGTVEISLGEGRTMQRPARRSSDLNRTEMADYLRWVEAFAARELALELS